MKKEIRTVVYDDELGIEAYRFEGIVQPFPNHFHEHYVMGVYREWRTPPFLQKSRVYDKERRYRPV